MEIRRKIRLIPVITSALLNAPINGPRCPANSRGSHLQIVSSQVKRKHRPASRLTNQAVRMSSCESLVKKLTRKQA